MHINNFICPAMVLTTVRDNHVNPLHKCRTNIRKGKIKIMWKTKGSWWMLVVPKPLFIGRRQALHRYRGRKLWVIREYPCLTEDSMVKVYLFNQKPVMNGFFRKAIEFMFRLLGSTTVFIVSVEDIGFGGNRYKPCCINSSERKGWRNK